MTIRIGPRTIRGEAEYHYEQQQARRNGRPQHSSGGGFGGALFGIGIMVVSFIVIREAVLVLWATIVEF